MSEDKIKNKRGDHIYSAIGAGGLVRITAAESTMLCEEARRIHGLAPTACAALGRTLTVCAILSNGLKNEDDALTLQIRGDGPLGSIVAVTDAFANVRGYVGNPSCDLPLNARGKLDVGGAVGQGYLNIIKDLGLKEPYSGTIPLVSGEIAEDVACYYAVSEQIPSVVSLGVLVGPGDDGENHVICAGGFMLQLMPGADESLISLLEDRVSSLKPVTQLLSEGKTIEFVMQGLLEGYDITDEAVSPCAYRCNCSREKMEQALINLGRSELHDIIETEGQAEISCQFCGAKHVFGKAELTDLLGKI